ncbi:MAG: SDR family oxidoreductase [Halobacteriaceae archaeon]
MPTVLVTGATGGIGSAVCAAFADEGATVVAGARDADALAALEGPAETVVADIREREAVADLAATAAETGEAGIDVVVPCAAVYPGAAGETPLPEEPYDAFDDAVATNARGVFATVRESLPHMDAGGRVLVPTGRVADGLHEGYGAYAVSKAAAEAVARGFAADADPAVGLVDPGVVATDLTGGDGREPGEVADLFVWAAERDHADLNGETVGLREWRKATR